MYSSINDDYHPSYHQLTVTQECLDVLLGILVCMNLGLELVLWPDYFIFIIPNQPAWLPTKLVVE